MARTKRKNLLKLGHPQGKDEEQLAEPHHDVDDEDQNVEVRIQRVLIIIPPESQAENVRQIPSPINAIPIPPPIHVIQIAASNSNPRPKRDMRMRMQFNQKRQILIKKTFRNLFRASSTGPPGLKAVLFKRKLERIGGLNPWLKSQGLGQFARIFHEQKISEAQLLSLSMQALKKLGIVPVGPRRKLIWAIDQLCKG